MLTLDDIETASQRIRPFIRRTPMLAAGPMRISPTAAELRLKLECLQPTGSFKVRGAMNKLMTTPREELRHGIVTASGGNHGLATARVAALSGVPATIFVPSNVSKAKLNRLKEWGADVRIVGRIWDEANVSALCFAAETGGAYFHPFADEAVIAGQGTVALEILEDMPDLDALLVAIGGGGLISGIAIAIKALKPSVRLIGIEAAGAPTLKASIDEGAVVTLAEVTTQVATLACRRTSEQNFEIIRRSVERIVLVEDEQMVDSARWLWAEFGLAADLSGAAAIAALQSGAVTFKQSDRICALVCGAGPEGLT